MRNLRTIKLLALAESMRYILYTILILNSFSSLANNQLVIKKFIDDQYVASETDMTSDSIGGELVKSFDHKSGLVSVFWTYSESNYYEERLYLLEIIEDTYQILDKLEIQGVLGRVKLDDVTLVGAELAVTTLDYSSTSVARCCPDIEDLRPVIVRNRRYYVVLQS